MKKIFLLTIISIFSFNSYSQYTGYTPWSDCFGTNASCKEYGCSAIKVITSNSNPVVVIVKQYDKVVKHAYIAKGSSYTLEVRDGTYQVFFYYGTSWNKNKKMVSSECSNLYGGWNFNERFDKDNSKITLKNQSMTYTLTAVTDGNFQTTDSSIEEAL